jgi:hypothetical protein
MSPPPGRKNKGKKPAILSIPAPALLDLPTRADIQAAQAVARAESSGLRGGWVMSMEAARSGLTSSLPSTRRQSMFSRRSSPRSSVDNRQETGESAEMVDIDLEAGQRRPFGSSPQSGGDRDHDDERGDRHTSAPVSRYATPDTTPASFHTPSSVSVDAVSNDKSWRDPELDATPRAVRRTWLEDGPQMQDSPVDLAPPVATASQGLGMPSITRGLAATSLD